MRQSYTQRVTERRLMYLLAAITAMLFAVKNYQETHTAAFAQSSLVAGSLAGAGSSIEDAAKEVQKALEEEAQKEEEARKRAQKLKQSKKKKVALAVFVHEGDYDRKFKGSTEGMLDNIAVQTSQVHRFRDHMTHDVQLIAYLSNVTQHYVPFFHRLGWQTKIVELPIQPSDIRNPQIAKEVVKDGAIGIWEMLKLEAWRPSSFDVEMIALVDTDIHFRQPFDRIFEPPWMAANATLGYTQGAWDIEKVNGGYLVVRPDERSEADYHKIYEVLREGDFRPGSGWRGKGLGWVYGGRTMQGLLPYYYMRGDGIGRGSEMPRCNVNNMVNSDLCKPTKPEDVISNHFTGGCMKPWQCGTPQHPLCKAFTAQWWEDVAVMEKFLNLPHRRRCPGGQYESANLRTSEWRLPEDAR